MITVQDKLTGRLAGMLVLTLTIWWPRWRMTWLVSGIGSLVGSLFGSSLVGRLFRQCRRFDSLHVMSSCPSERGTHSVKRVPALFHRGECVQ